MSKKGEDHMGCGEQMTPEKIEEFMEYLSEKGRSPSSIQNYRGILNGLYESLPDSKQIDGCTGLTWKQELESRGLLPATVDARLSVWNSFVQYLGRREWQVGGYDRNPGRIQPELSRTEYLRLLAAAKRMKKEESYLLIKTLGGAGVRIQELSQLTVEALQQGMLLLEHHNAKGKRMLRIPNALQEELLDYAARKKIREGPVFVTARGTPLNRSSVHRYVNGVSREAQVPEEKANPRCLWRMYQKTCLGIQSSITILVEQAYERMLETEQITIGWKV